MRLHDHAKDWSILGACRSILAACLSMGAPACGRPLLWQLPQGGRGRAQPGRMAAARVPGPRHPADLHAGPARIRWQRRYGRAHRRRLPPLAAHQCAPPLHSLIRGLGLHKRPLQRSRPGLQAAASSCGCPPVRCPAPRRLCAGSRGASESMSPCLFVASPQRPGMGTGCALHACGRLSACVSKTCEPWAGPPPHLQVHESCSACSAPKCMVLHLGAITQPWLWQGPLSRS